ncbi:MAG: hypothetical protein EA349_05195 [Halomonadaceae bacterium]|nr:MAG: hypothetical protein EA349_05195 [Halomonadaceae bacterium]
MELNVTFPEIATVSFYQELTERFALAGGATWTNWSRLPEIRFTYTDSSNRGGSDITGSGDDVRRRDLVQPFAWENTWRYGLGLIFTASERWTFRAGAARDESPVPDEIRRTPRGPDNDRTIGSLGLTWTPSSRYSIDAGYTFTRFDKADIASPENPAGTGHVIDGNYEGRLHTAALQINYRF